jgi:ribosomal protein L40E
MSNYSWVCFACEASNPPGAEVCARCGFSARAKGQEIARAKEAQRTVCEPLSPEDPASIALNRVPKRPEPSALVALLLVGFGVLCLVGGYQSFANGHWPAFMPPQLDLLAVPLSWLSERLGAWVGGALAVVVGLVCVVAGIFGARR